MNSPRPHNELWDFHGIPCIEIDCTKTAVVSTIRCRGHLLEALRREGEPIDFKGTDFAELMAAVVQIVKNAFVGLPEDLFRARGSRTALDMYAFMDLEAPWAAAHVALDFLATHLADTMGSVRLWPPSRDGSDVLLHARVVVPADAVNEFCSRLEFAVEAIMREMVGWGVDLGVLVRLVEEQEGSVA